MDRYAVRLLLTAVMFGAVAVSATLFSDALTQTAGSEPLPAPRSSETEQLQKPNIQTAYLVSVHTQRPSGTVTVLDADGRQVTSCQTDAQGDGSVGPLLPGHYYARANRTDYVLFSLSENAAVCVQRGSGWADGERLYLTEYRPSRLDLTCKLPEEDDSVILTVTLQDETGQRSEQTGYVKDGAVQLVFDGLRAGTYQIFHGDTELATTQIDGRTSLTVTLP